MLSFAQSAVRVGKTQEEDGGALGDGCRCEAGSGQPRFAVTSSPDVGRRGYVYFSHVRVFWIQHTDYLNAVSQIYSTQGE